jgi:LacI family transcriptional regulator
LLEFAKAEAWPCHILTPRKQSRGLPLSATVRWLAQLPKPVGIAIFNMAEARKVVEACQLAGVQVPEEVAVVAWDDDPTLAETLEPTISAAVLPAERLGFEAARLLDQCLSGTTLPDMPLVIEPMGILHVRQSSDVSALKDRDAHLALQYIREHGTGPLKVSHIAAALGVSRSKLEREFVRAIKQTPHEAILQVRLARARELMVETTWSLEKVADRSGLGTKETLRRVFARFEGMTPGAYRIRFSGT